jgi:hypothetical protein
MAPPFHSLTCADCARFTDEPRLIEALFAGITALSSAYGSSRGRAGVCHFRDTFQDPEPVCRGFLARDVVTESSAGPAAACGAPGGIGGRSRPRVRRGRRGRDDACREG